MSTTTWRRERAWRSGGRGKREGKMKRRQKGVHGGRITGPTRSQAKEKGTVRKETKIKGTEKRNSKKQNRNSKNKGKGKAKKNKNVGKEQKKDRKFVNKKPDKEPSKENEEKIKNRLAKLGLTKMPAPSTLSG